MRLLVALDISQLLSAQPAAKKGVGQYFVGPRIGRGGFGDVLLGTHKVTNEKIALKFIPVRGSHANIWCGCEMQLLVLQLANQFHVAACLIA